MSDLSGPQGLRSLQFPVGYKEDSIRLTRSSAIQPVSPTTASQAAQPAYPVPSSDNSRVLSDLTDELAFVKQYSRRLEGELRAYQIKYPALSQNEVKSIEKAAAEEDDLTPPWLSSSRHVSPLLLAYEGRIEEYQHRIKEKENQENNMKRENARLNKQIDDLESELEVALNQLNGLDSLPARPAAAAPTTPASELEEQIQLLQEQNDLLARNEADLQQYVQALLHSQSQKLSEFEQKARGDVKALKGQLEEAIKERDQYKEKNSIYIDTQKRIVALQEEFEALERHHEDERTKASRLSQQLAMERQQAQQTQAKYQTTKKDLDALLKSLESVEQNYMENQRRLTDAAAANERLQSLVADSAVASGLIEAKEQQWKDRAEALQSRLAQAEAQHAVALETLKRDLYSQHKSVEAKLMEEIKMLELASVELHTDNERMKREIESAEARAALANEEFERSLSEMNARVVSLNESNIDLKGASELADEISAKRLAEAQRLRGYYEKEFHHYQSQLHDLKQKHELSQLQAQRAANERDVLAKERKAIESEYQGRLQVMEHHLKQAKYSYSELESRKSGELNEQRMRFDSLIGDYAQLEAKYNELAKQMSEFQGSYQDKEKKLHSHYLNQLSALQSEIAALRQSHTAMDGRLALTIREKETLMNRLNEQEDTLQATQADVAQLESTIHKLNGDLLRSHDQETFANNENKNLLNRLDRLELERSKLKAAFEGATRKWNEQTRQQWERDQQAATGAEAAQRMREYQGQKRQEAGLKSFNALIDKQLAAIHTEHRPALASIDNHNNTNKGRPQKHKQAEHESEIEEEEVEAAL